MNELEQPIHLAFKNEIDLILRYQKKLHYLNTLTKILKKWNSLKFILLYSFIFFIFPITGLFLIYSFFQKNFNPNKLHNDKNSEIFAVTNLSSLLVPAMFYNFINYLDYNAYALFKIHVAFVIIGIILICGIHIFSLKISDIYFNRMINKISQRRNNEFTPFFSNLNKISSFKIQKKMLFNSNVFFQSLFYIFYQQKYAEDKHLFIYNEYLSQPPCEFHEMYAFFFKNEHEHNYIFFDYSTNHLTPYEITEITNDVVTLMHQRDFNNSLTNYLSAKKREHILISKLNISEKDSIRNKQKI